MAKVLFIVHDLHQQDNHFPVGIGYLSAVLEKEGHDVRVVSQDVFHYSNADVCGIISEYRPDIIGVGFLAARFTETVLPLCKAINEVKGDAWLVLGGHGASGCPEYILEQTGADHIIVGEGELVIPELARFYKIEKTLNMLEELSSPGGYRINGDTPIKDLDSLPFPSWHLFPIKQYSESLKLPGWEPGDRTLGILTSRGCVGKCNFCYRMSKGVRTRSVENVIEEIKQLNKVYGINYFFMQDELFVLSKKRMFDFQAALSRENLRIKFACDSRVNIVDKDLLDCLKDAGCQYLDYGFESMDNYVLASMGKGTTAEQNYRCAYLTKRAGIPFNMNLLWGNIGDTASSLRRNVEFIKEFDSRKNMRTIRPPTPYPGCELYHYAMREGKLDGPADFFDKFKNSDLLTVNFTEMSDSEFYNLLYQANADLIRWHYEGKAYALSSAFRKLYFDRDYSFRGARHYV